MVVVLGDGPESFLPALGVFDLVAEVPEEPADRDVGDLFVVNQKNAVV